MSFNRRPVKSTVVCHEILLSNKKGELLTHVSMWTNLQRVEKNPTPKVPYILHYSIYITFLKRYNYRNEEQVSGFPKRSREGEQGREAAVTLKAEQEPSCEDGNVLHLTTSESCELLSSGKNRLRTQEIPLYYFLQLHRNLQLSQNKKLNLKKSRESLPEDVLSR